MHPKYIEVQILDGVSRKNIVIKRKKRLCAASHVCLVLFVITTNVSLEQNNNKCEQKETHWWGGADPGG